MGIQGGKRMWRFVRISGTAIMIGVMATPLMRPHAVMAASGAEYCVFNCPACQIMLSEKVAKKGLKPVHIIELCRMALGEHLRAEEE